MEVEALVDAPAAVALVHVLEADDVLAGARCRLELEHHRLPALGRLDPIDLRQLLDAALHLGGVRGARLEALDELDLLGQHRLLTVELGLLLLFAQRPLLLVERVVARVRRQRAAVDLDDLGDDAVHELAVVRGHQQHAFIGPEKVLQPDEAFQIEVVARLVEQHGVGAHEQDAGQRHAHLPAAGKGADVPVHHLLAEAQPGQHLARFAFERIAAQLLEAPLHLAVALDDVFHLVGAVGIGHGGLELFQLGGDGAHRAGTVHHLGDGAAPAPSRPRPG